MKQLLAGVEFMHRHWVRPAERNTETETDRETETATVTETERQR